jgi:5-methylcytosine-specific restriction endonuclease McrA
MADAKVCTKCGEPKSLAEFYRMSSRPDGRRPNCKACVNSYAGAYREANREAINERQRRYNSTQDRSVVNEYLRRRYQTNPEPRLMSSARRRASVKGVQSAHYSRSDIFAAYGHKCAYCDAPAEHLDHVVPLSRGGADAAHNLLPACAPCNLAKGAKTLADWALTWLA